MSQLAPPAPPLRVALADDDGQRRVQARLYLLSWAVATVLVTAWLCTLGWVPAILSLVVAKHVLVALLVMGLGVDDKEGRGRILPPV